jgi:3-phenylpropionate/cinnamic acid dioxygenase small subunit
MPEGTHALPTSGSPAGDLPAEAAALIYREADLLDRRQWRDWLDLYTEDAVLWVPSWADEEQTIENPELELNLIYLVGKGSFEARVLRIESRDSYASLPLPRTMHVVGNLRRTGGTDDAIELAANVLTLACDTRRGKSVRGGRSEFLLRRTDEGLRIARKKIVLLEEAIDGPIDIYHI